MNDVNVHYNSQKPAQLKALAFTQGTDIHIGPGQERHLPHEAWHVVQQKRGGVRATLQAKGFKINADPGLEKEADEMGSRAALIAPSPNSQPQLSAASASASDIVQGYFTYNQKKVPAIYDFVTSIFSYRPGGDHTIEAFKQIYEEAKVPFDVIEWLEVELKSRAKKT